MGLCHQTMTKEGVRLSHVRDLKIHTGEDGNLRVNTGWVQREDFCFVV